MQVKVERVTPWSRALNAARWTVGKEQLDKEPSNTWKHTIIRAEHSPIRLVEYDIWFTDIPAFVAAHLVRHHVGTIPFQCTRREDRVAVDPREINRLTPVDLMLSCNTQALIDISRKRLCGMAHKDTIAAWREVKKKIAEIDPLVARYMVANCIYRGFCPETKCCGYVCGDKYGKELGEYRYGKE